MTIKSPEFIFNPELFDEAEIVNGKNRIIKGFRKNISFYERYACLDLLFYINSDYKAASKVCQEALKRPAELTTYEFLEMSIALADNIRTSGDDIRRSLTIIDTALRHPSINKFQETKGNLYNILGLVRQELDYEDSLILESYREAEDSFLIELNQAKKNRVQHTRLIDAIGRVYNNLGLFFTEKRENLEQSEIYYKKALRFKRRVGHLIGICRVQANLCHTLLKQNKSRQFYYRFQKAMELITKYDLFMIGIELFYNIGIFFCKQGKNTRGINFLKKALLISTQKLSSQNSFHEKIKTALKRTGSRII